MGKAVTVSTRDHLIFKALVVIDQARAACREAPLAPSLGLRFALAYLYAQSAGERRPYDNFWRMIQDPCAHQDEAWARQYFRSTNATGLQQAIIRGLGFHPTVQLDHILSDAHEKNMPGAVDAFWAHVAEQFRGGTIKTPRPEGLGG